MTAETKIKLKEFRANRIKMGIPAKKRAKPLETVAHAIIKKHKARAIRAPSIPESVVSALPNLQ